MSGSLWMANLVPASFRGVPFAVDGHDYRGGRRLANHEYPNRDTPSVDDLGRKSRVYKITAYVIADQASGDYFAARSAFVQACEAVSGPGILSHPWLGSNLSVYCHTIGLREDIARGGMAAFDVEFWEAGTAASPTATPATAAGVLSGLGEVQSILAQGAAIAQRILAAPAVLLAFAAGTLGLVASAVAGVASTIASNVAIVLSATDPALVGITAAIGTVNALAGGLAAVVNGSNLNGGASVTGAITGVTGDPVAVAVVELSAALSNAVLAAQAGSNDLGPVTGQVLTALRMPPDPTFGIADLTDFGATLAAPVGFGAMPQGVLQAAIVALVTAAATLSVATIYASTDFTSSNAAAAARAQVLGMIADQVTLAAAAANDPLYQAWSSLAALISADLIARIQALPSITDYTTPRSMPACVIAQRLYGDGTRAAELALLNDAVHPGFMPSVGICLSS